MAKSYATGKKKWPNHIISIYNSYFFTLKKNNNKIK